MASGGLTSVELSLVERVGRGECLNLAADDEAVDEASMRSWGDSRTCRATVIRDILRGRLAADPDPHGLRLRGARITGRLDLENVTTDVNLELADCILEEGVLARDACLAFVALTGCQFEHPAEPPLDGARLTCSVLRLNGARVIGHNDTGAVNLFGAHITGPVGFEGADLRNDSGPALFADGLRVDQDMFMRGGFRATGSSDDDGIVRLLGAHVGGNLEFVGAHLRNDSGPALFADGLRVDQDMFMRGGFRATGSGDDDGIVRLLGAHIGGNLEFDGAHLRNDSGPALNADNLDVDQDMLLGGCRASGSGGPGAVRLFGAHIGGRLDGEGADLRNDSGPDLFADGLRVDQDVFMRGGFRATGSGDAGAVRLLGARIGGNLDCTRAKLRNKSGSALNAGSLQVGQDLNLTDGFTAAGGGKDVAVDLTGAQVRGAFRFDPKRLKHKVGPHQRLAVDGLTYPGLPKQILPQCWRVLLRDATPRYAAQPYQWLAAAFRALGDERQARETLMRQRDDQLARTDTRRRERLWGWITKVTLGYGYQPWRALLFLAAVVAVSCVLAVVLGSHGALAQTTKTATPGRPCTVVQQVSVGLDLNLPVGTSVARADCELTTDSDSVTAAWLTAVSWFLRLLAWMFAALFIAGFTSAVRKT